MVALAFILGTSLGFTLGVLSQFGIFAVFIRWQEEKSQKRLVRIQQEAAKYRQHLEKVRSQMRQRYADQDATDEEVNAEVEQVLGTGPGGR